MPAITPALPGAERVSLAVLLRDERIQIRNALHSATVDKYANAMAAGAEFPPVRVVRCDGLLFLVDGFHRVAAAELRGLDELDAIVTEGSVNDARWLAASANLTHGLPLTPKELRRAFSAYIATKQHRDGTRHKSYREIARELGGTRRHTTIRNWMRRDHPKIADKMTTVYPDDEPPKNAGSGWPRTPNAHTFAVEGASLAFASVLATLDTLPRDAAQALNEELRRALDEVAMRLSLPIELPPGTSWRF